VTYFVSNPILTPFWDFRKMSGGGKPPTEAGADEKLMRKEEVVALPANVFADDKKASTIFIL
jgi:hypothetical protein